MNDVLITWAGFSRANEQLAHLKKTVRREIAERIRTAVLTERNVGESADYLDAREEQARLERKIARLERKLTTATIVAPDPANGVLDVGERTRLRDLQTNEIVEYELVGSLEADPDAGRISAASPVGRALLGRGRGEVAVVEAPQGRLAFEVLEIMAPPGRRSRGSAGCEPSAIIRA